MGLIGADFKLSEVSLVLNVTFATYEDVKLLFGEHIHLIYRGKVLVCRFALKFTWDCGHR